MERRERPVGPGGVVLLLLALGWLACAGQRPPNLGPTASGLLPCPPSPNCVSSHATDGEHDVAPFPLSVAPEEAWSVVVEEVAALPRTTVVEERLGYLHAECASLIFGFVDDLELHLHGAEIDLRSAARTGQSDLGVNRRRVEELRESLRARGVID